MSYLELLPAVDVKDGRAVRLVQGELDRESVYGSPLEVALEFQAAGAEWLHLVDLDAAFGRGENSELLASVVKALDIKVELSGGIRDDESLRRTLGTLMGPNFELLKEVCAATQKPVIASGGISSIADIEGLAQLRSIGVEGAIVGKALYAGAFTLQEALKASGK